MSSFRMRTGVGYSFKCPIDQVGPPTGMACGRASIGGCPAGYHECGTPSDASGVSICCLSQDAPHPPDLAEKYETVRKAKVRPVAHLRARMIDRPPGRRMVQARVGARAPVRARVRAHASGTRSCKAKVTHKGLWVCCQGTCRLAVRTPL